MPIDALHLDGRYILVVVQMRHNRTVRDTEEEEEDGACDERYIVISHGEVWM